MKKKLINKKGKHLILKIQQNPYKSITTSSALDFCGKDSFVEIIKHLKYEGFIEDCSQGYQLTSKGYEFKTRKAILKKYWGYIVVTTIFVAGLIASLNGSIDLFLKSSKLFNEDENPKIEFSLSGKINGFENGTLLFLSHNNSDLDSTIIKNNSFVFDTKLISSPIQLWLHNKDFSSYRAFWAENNSMTFDATKTDFRNAEITGSESENLSYSLYQKIDTLPRNERRKMEIEFVRNNPTSIVGVSILSIYSTTWGKEKTNELYDLLSTENKNSEFGKEIKRYLELNKEPKIGDQFVDFESEDQNGKLNKLSELNGKVILLEFWASWCGPCRQENPNLVKTYNTFNPKGFEIFAVSLDEDKESWLKAIEMDNLKWEHVSDLKGNRNEASLIYGINGIPDNFLISENGKIIGRNLRGDKLNQKLKEILK